jgi:sugar O-acyltransferase (sialic acid O-acetyltransferase NeuD family)
MCNKQIIIFGTGSFGEYIYHCFKYDSDYEVCAFTASAARIDSNIFCGLPVVAFENINSIYPPEAYDMFITVGYSYLNETRKEKYFFAKSLGYKLVSYISSKAMILNDYQIGDNCFISAGCIIHPFAKIGNDIIILDGSLIGHHSIIRDHSFFSARSIVASHVEVDEQCFIGIGAIIRDGLKIGKKCLLGAGSLILKDADPNGVYGEAETRRAKVSSNDFVRLGYI